METDKTNLNAVLYALGELKTYKTLSNSERNVAIEAMNNLNSTGIDLGFVFTDVKNNDIILPKTDIDELIREVLERLEEYEDSDSYSDSSSNGSKKSSSNKSSSNKSSSKEEAELEDEEADEVEDEEAEVEDEAEAEEELHTSSLSEQADSDEDDSEDEDTIEGFHGSQIVESRDLKNILLALLISFFGYIVVISSIKNFLPINEYMPHMKKFKNLIYLGLFFIITFMCLEVF